MKVLIPMAQNATIDRARASLAATRRVLWSVGVFSFFINLLMLTGPIFMLQVYDSVLVSKSIPTLIALFTLAGALFLFLGLLDFVRSRVMVRAGMQFEEQVQVSTFDGVVDQSLKRQSGNTIQPLRDMETVRGFISSGGPAAFYDMPWVPVYIAVIFIFHWTLGLLAVAAAVLLFIIALVSEFITRAPVIEAGQASNQSNALAEEARRNAEVLRSMGMLTAFRSRWQLNHDKARSAQATLNDRMGSMTSVTKSLRLFLQSAMLAAGAALAVQEIISPGVMIAASIILSRALAPVEQSIGLWRSFQAARAAFGRLRHFLNGSPARHEQMTLPEPEGRVSVENLVVQLGAEVPTLANINFTLLAGGGLGIIGATGSGKSTLARTLVGGIRPVKGSVRLDGATVDQWPEAQLGSVVGYLPQNVELFSGTIRENIARFTQADDEDVYRAAKLADVHDMIMRMPEGYATDVGDAGGMISAGQRQRIALARAVFGNPKVVILDEPNSNLDGDGEVALVRAMAALREAGSTVIVIAHRPSGVQAVDQLLYLERGQQTLYGPKNDVLAELKRRQSERLAAAQKANAPRQVSHQEADSADGSGDQAAPERAPKDKARRGPAAAGPAKDATKDVSGPDSGSEPPEGSLPEASASPPEKKPRAKDAARKERPSIGGKASRRPARTRFLRQTKKSSSPPAAE